MSEYYVIRSNPEHSDELQHYGVLGMKWGVRRGKADKVYAKASKKLAKLDKKATKHQEKAIKKSRKAATAWYGRDVYREQVRRSRRRSLKSMRKAEKLVKNMNKAFKDTPINLTQEQIAIGRRYVDSLTVRSSLMLD